MHELGADLIIRVDCYFSFGEVASLLPCSVITTAKYYVTYPHSGAYHNSISKWLNLFNSFNG